MPIILNYGFIRNTWESLIKGHFVYENIEILNEEDNGIVTKYRICCGILEIYQQIASDKMLTILSFDFQTLCSFD